MARAFEFTGNEFAEATRLRPSSGGGNAAPRTAGPFDVAPAEGQGGGFGSVLMTALLVVYPAFATVAAIVVGLSLSGNGA